MQNATPTLGGSVEGSQGKLGDEKMRFPKKEVKTEEDSGEDMSEIRKNIRKEIRNALVQELNGGLNSHKIVPPEQQQKLEQNNLAHH